MGLVNNQIQLVHVNILLETINSKPSHERPTENEDYSEFFESIELNQPPRYVLRYLKAVAKQDSLPLGSDDVIILEELEETEEDSWSEATLRYDKLLTGEEII